MTNTAEIQQIKQAAVNLDQLQESKVSLRDYQREIIALVYEHMREGKKRILVQLPTGGGKSAIIGQLTRASLLKSKRVLIIAHRTELLEQINQHLIWAGIPTNWQGWIKAEKPETLELPIQIASIQTWNARWKTWKNGASQSQLSLLDWDDLAEQPGQPGLQDAVLGGTAIASPIKSVVLGGLAGRKRWWKRDDGLPRFDLILVDEAHHSCAESYTNLLKFLYPESIVIGVTATPCRQDGKPLGEIYQAMVQGPTVRELIEWGYLSPYLLVRGEKNVSLKGLKKLGGEFQANDEAIRRFSSEAFLGDMTATWKKYIEPLANQRTILFALRCDHAKLLAHEYNLAGIPAGYVDGKMSATEREEVLIKFILGEIVVLSQVGLIGEGFDLAAFAARTGLTAADVAAVQFGRPWGSLSAWLQACGRALRPSQGKTAYIIDHALSHEKLGFPCDAIDWSLEQQVKPKPKHRKTCGRCKNKILQELKICPICGFEPKEMQKAEALLEPVREEDKGFYWQEANMIAIDPKVFDQKIEEWKRSGNAKAKLQAELGRSVKNFSGYCAYAHELDMNPWRVWFSWEEHLLVSGLMQEILEVRQDGTFNQESLLAYLKQCQSDLRKLVRLTNEKNNPGLPSNAQWFNKVKQPPADWAEKRLSEILEKMGLIHRQLGLNLGMRQQS